MSEQKRRSDYGTVRATERDLALLRWIGEQFAVDTDQLKILMNRWKRAHEPDWAEESLSDEAVRWMIKRWRGAGWVKSRKLLAHRPAWVWLTKRGLADMELDLPPYTPRPGSVNHIYHVNMVRLYIEERLGAAVQWVSERRVNQERKRERKRHKVDGEAIYQGQVIGIEVEQTQKSRRRLAGIVSELRADYEAVWYFVAEEALAAVTEAVARVEGTADREQWQTFAIYPMATILANMGF